MKRIACAAALSVVAGAWAAGCGAPPPPAGTPVPAAAAATANWTDAYRQAAGAPAVAALKTFRFTGIVINPADSANRRIEVDASAPALFRQAESPMDPAGRPQVLRVGYDGAEGWWSGNTMLGGDGLSPDPDTRRRAIRTAARQNYVNVVAGAMPLWLIDAGLTLTVVGEIQDGEDRGALAIEITAGTDRLGRLIIDPATHLPRRLVVPYHRHIRPNGGEYTLSYQDYRPVDGLLLPHGITRRDPEQGRADIVWTVRAWQVNPPLPDETFRPPARVAR